MNNHHHHSASPHRRRIHRQVGYAIRYEDQTQSKLTSSSLTLQLAREQRMVVSGCLGGGGCWRRSNLEDLLIESTSLAFFVSILFAFVSQRKLFDGGEERCYGEGFDAITKMNSKVMEEEVVFDSDWAAPRDHGLFSDFKQSR